MSQTLNLETLPVPEYQEQHRRRTIVAIVGLFLIYIVTLILNGIAGKVGWIQDIGDISDKYPLFITPAGVTFAIWALIYTWLFLMFVFYVATIFMKNDFGRLYLFPKIITHFYVIFFQLNLIFNCVWLFVWGNEDIVGASVLLFLVAFTNIATLAVLSINLAQDDQRLKLEQPKIYWTYVGLAQNGHATYTTWTCIACLINFAHALHYSAGMAMETVCLISLSALVILATIWFVLENFFFDNFVRFVITPYLVIIWGTYGIMKAQSEKDGTINEATQTIKDYTLGVFILAIIMFVARLAHIAFMQWKRPIKFT